MGLISVTMEQAYQNSLRASVEAISKGAKVEDAAKILAGIFSNKSLIQIQEDLEDMIFTVDELGEFETSDENIKNVESFSEAFDKEASTE